MSADDCASYWAFVNYLFERGSRTVGESLDPLLRQGVPPSLASLPVRDLDVTVAIEFFAAQIPRRPALHIANPGVRGPATGSAPWTNLFPQSSGQVRPTDGGSGPVS